MLPKRLKYFELSKESLKGLKESQTHALKSDIPKEIMELVYLRVSQLNECRFCIKMHTLELLKLNTTPEKISELLVWKSSEMFSSRERAALQWADELTKITETQGSDESFAELLNHFNEVQASDLTFAVATINALNRVATSMRH